MSYQNNLQQALIEASKNLAALIYRREKALVKKIYELGGSVEDVAESLDLAPSTIYRKFSKKHMLEEK